jgi:hypothetical protein
LAEFAAHGGNDAFSHSQLGNAAKILQQTFDPL